MIVGKITKYFTIQAFRQLFMHILDYYLSTNSLYEARINVSYFNDSSFRIEFAMPALNSTLDTDKEINEKLSTAKLITKKLGGNLSFKNNNNTILITVNIQAIPTENHSRSQLDLELLKNLVNNKTQTRRFIVSLFYNYYFSIITYFTPLCALS